LKFLTVLLLVILITLSFFFDVRDLLETLLTIHSEFFILGYFNLHLDTQSTVTPTFNIILASFDLKQHVSFSTHFPDYWLDLLTAQSTPNYIHTLTTTNGSPSLHNPIDSKCNILYRYPHNIDIPTFNDDIVKSQLIMIHKADVSQLCEQYHTALKTLFQKHALVRSKST